MLADELDIAPATILQMQQDYQIKSQIPKALLLNWRMEQSKKATLTKLLSHLDSLHWKAISGRIYIILKLYSIK